MEGSSSVLRRFSMATLALGLVFGIPNITHAQTPRFEPTRLPLQSAEAISPKKLFDQSWIRIVADTQLLLRQFSAPFPISAQLDVDAAARSLEAPAMRNAAAPTAIAPQTSTAPQVNISSVRVTFTPVEFTSGVAAESRRLDGVLAGAKFEWVD